MAVGFSRDMWYNYIADRSHPPVASAVVEKPEYDPDHVYAWKPANNYKGWKLIARGEAGVDDAEVIQSAIDKSNSKVILNGYFELQDTVVINMDSDTKRGFTLEGLGKNTILKSPAGKPVLKVTGAHGFATFLTIRDIRFEGDKGILITEKISRVNLENLVFYNINGYAIKTEALWDSQWVNIDIQRCGSDTEPALWLTNSTDESDTTNNIYIADLIVWGPHGVGIKMEKAEKISICGGLIHGELEGTYPYPLMHLINCYSVKVFGFRITRAHDKAIIIEGRRHNILDQCIIEGGRNTTTLEIKHSAEQNAERNIISRCYFETNGEFPETVHIDATNSYHTKIESCIIRTDNDGVYAGWETRIQNCLIIASKILCNDKVTMINNRIEADIDVNGKSDVILIGNCIICRPCHSNIYTDKSTKRFNIFRPR